MEKKEEIVVGLDIGTTKICTIVGRKNEFGKIDILGFGKCESLGVTRGVVTNIVNTIDSIKLSVKEASERSNVEIGSVYVGIAGQHIKSPYCFEGFCHNKTDTYAWTNNTESNRECHT